MTDQSNHVNQSNPAADQSNSLSWLAKNNFFVHKILKTE